MFIADTHCDTIGYVLRGTARFIDKHNASELPHLQVYAMFCEFPLDSLENTYKEAAERENMPFETQGELVDLFVKKYYECVSGDDRIVHCENMAEADNAINGGRFASMLSVEGCDFIRDIKKLEEMRKKGVRLAGLTWNYNNIIGCGAPMSGKPEDTGLTDYGREFVKACEALGIVVDVSHASDRTIDDVLCVAKKPIIASHSNFREVCNHPRNLKKEHSDEIVRRGGYIGLNIYSSFIKEGVKLEDYSKEMIKPHIEYLIDKGYTDNVGFGFDIDGVSWEYPRDISLEKSIHDQYLSVIKDAIGSRSGVEAVLNKIAGENFRQFMIRYDGGI